MQRRAANTQHLCVLPTMRRWFRRGNGERVRSVKRHCRHSDFPYSENSALSRYGVCRPTIRTQVYSLPQPSPCAMAPVAGVACTAIETRPPPPRGLIPYTLSGSREAALSRRLLLSRG